MARRLVVLSSILILLAIGYAKLGVLAPNSTMVTDQANVAQITDAHKAAQNLRNRFSQEDSVASSGWSLRDIHVVEKNISIIINFPPSSKGKSRMAPVYSELVRYCPVAGFDSYWEKDFAHPFTLYIANEGKNSARAIARCTRAFDKKMYERAIVKTAAQKMVVIPKEGESQEMLIAAAASGLPSFNQAKEMVLRGRTKELQDSLNNRPELVDLYDDAWKTLLFYAKSAETVKILIGYGANPNIKQRDGATALSWLSELGNSYSVVKALINGGAHTSDVEVAFVSKEKIAKLLLKNGAPIHENSLFMAIKEGHLAVAEILYAHGARLDNTTAVDSPLHFLASSIRDNYSNNIDDAIQRFSLALQLGADPSKKVKGQTVLQYLQRQPSWQGREELITMLLSRGT